jgi:hypothetical protein
MTDARAALAQVREALADPMLFDWARDWDRARAIRAFERSCTTANITAILAHVEAQAAEIELQTAERDDLRRQLAEAELDAQRYRWLRNEANTARKCDPMVCIYPLDDQDLIEGDRLDVAIDAAMGLTRPAEEA